MKAASSAFTYLVLHPDDKIMQSNLKHYSESEDVDMNKIVNLEAKVSNTAQCINFNHDYIFLYLSGLLRVLFFHNYRTTFIFTFMVQTLTKTKTGMMS